LEAASFPSFTVMAMEWFPSPERSFMFTVATGGPYLGTALAGGALLKIARIVLKIAHIGGPYLGTALAGGALLKIARMVLKIAHIGGSYLGTALAFPIAGFLMNAAKAPQDPWSKAHHL
jgi:hypothetical protein